MKKSFQKKKLWIIIAAALVVVLAISTTAVMLLVNRGDADETQGVASDKIYWNIDRLRYYGKGENTFSSRERSKDDGLYHILFCVDGRPTERKVASQSVVNKIDDNDAMGLIRDEKTGAITDIIPLSELGASYYCKNFYVKDINPEKFEITADSSATLNGLDIKIKLKSTTPVIDVSTQAADDAGMPVKFESIEKKDQITLIKNEDGSFEGLYIVKRSANLKVYWNLNRQYDKGISATKRTPDGEGVYHIEMAMGGDQYEILCKDRTIVNKIDGAVCCGLGFDKEGYVNEFIHVYRCTGGKSAASWFCVDGIEEDALQLHKYITGANDSGQDRVINLSPDCEVYNVSKNFEDHCGEKTEIKIDDTIQAYSDITGKVVLLFVVNRYKGGNVYWNVYRSWDTKKLSSTRKPSSDGYYHFIMAHDGKTTDYKVASKALADKIDSIAARTMSLTINGDFITDCESASGIQYLSKASWYDVMSFKSGNVAHASKTIPTSSDYGRETDLNLASDCKIYNVSEMYEDHLGEETTLRAGDRIQAWADAKNQIKYLFVMDRKLSNSQTAHSGNHTCKDCGKNVTWTPWTSATSLPTKSGHYYLCGNVVSKQTNIEKGQNVVLCLNGYSVRAGGTRLYSTYYENSSLTIDNCRATGKLYSKYQGNFASSFGNILWARKGNIKVYNTKIIAPEVTVLGNGAAVYVAENLKVGFYNCEITGGKTEKNGGAIFVSGSELTLENTTVKSGTAGGGKGDGLYLTSKSKLYAGGKVVISGGKSNLYLSSAAVYLDKNNPLTAGSKIGINTISATGKVTTSYIEGVEKYFASDTTDREIIVADNAVYAIKRYSAGNHKAHICKDCGDSSKWTPWTNPKVLPTESGHYYLCGDVTVGQQKTVPANTDVTICLNGHNIISNAKRPYLVNGTGARLTLTDCTGKGKIYNSTKNNVYGTDGKGRIILVGGGAELNIFDIAVVSPSYKSDIEGGGAIAVNAGGSLKIKDAEIIGGPVTGSGGAINTSTNCSVNLENVKIKSGKADTSGDAIYLGSGSTLGLAGKIEISGGDNQVYLKGALIHFNDAISGNTISVKSSAADGKISDNYIYGVEKYIVSTDDDLSVIESGGALYIGKEIEAHKHLCDECGSEVEWTAWNSTTSLPTAAGHYYLTDNVTVNSQANIKAGVNVAICLNGFDIKSTAKRAFLVNGENAKLTITNCQSGGKIFNSTTNVEFKDGDHGRVILAGGGATLNLYNVTVAAPGYKSTVNGGAIASNAKATINIVNSKISGGDSTKDGGAIYIGGNGKATLKDVEIVSGKADGNGDAIFVGTGTKLSLAGKVAISGGDTQIYLKSTIIHFEDTLTAGSGFSVDTESTDGIISDNTFTGAADIITSGKSGYTVEETDGVLVLTEEVVTPPVTEHTNHTCDECGSEVEWTAWSSTTSLPTEAGHYYLTDNVTVSSQGSVKAGENVILCLNGFDIKSSAKRAYLVNGENAKLTITNCKTTGKIYNGTETDKYAATDQGRVLLCGGGATLNLYNLTVEAPEYKSTSNGGAIASNSKATVNITNCKIIGRDTAKDGGAIYLGGNGKATLKDVEIVSGKAEGNGDAIFVGTGTTLNLAGKITISGGTDQIYLKATPVHFVSALSEGSSFSISTEAADKKISDNYFEGMENVVSSGESGMKISVVDNTYLKLVTASLLGTFKPKVVTGGTSLEPKSAAITSLKIFSEKYNLLKEVGIA